MFTDIPTRDWVAQKLPAFLRPYARLMRLDRPIGTWLLLLPCWWGVALACRGMPNLWLMFLFAVGSVIMRGAGCVVNDLYDRDLDRQVARTATRPLASGEVEPWQAIILIALLLLIGCGILLLLNHTAVVIGLASLFLIFTYPLMKRITWWPQLFLGITFNWGALVGWAAETGTLSAPVGWLYAAGIVWTLAYDTIYAHQDVQDDERIGVKSTARLFGVKSKRWVGAFYVLTILFILGAGHSAGLGKGFYVLMIWAASFAYGQWDKWRMFKPENCLQRFRSSRDFGLIVLLAIIIGKFV
jgi:4-hydroxybenzoate polyprenyltransferase